MHIPSETTWELALASTKWYNKTERARASQFSTLPSADISVTQHIDVFDTTSTPLLDHTLLIMSVHFLDALNLNSGRIFHIAPLISAGLVTADRRNYLDVHLHIQ